MTLTFLERPLNHLALLFFSDRLTQMIDNIATTETAVPQGTNVSKGTEQAMKHRAVANVVRRELLARRLIT